MANESNQDPEAARTASAGAKSAVASTENAVPATDAGICAYLRTKAEAWMRLMPGCIRSDDGRLVVRLPPPGSDERWTEAGFERLNDGCWVRPADAPLAIAERELATALRALAALAARLRLSATPAFKFADLLDRGSLASLAHYTLCEEVEFLVMAIENIVAQPTIESDTREEDPASAAPEVATTIAAHDDTALTVLGRLIQDGPELALRRIKSLCGLSHDSTARRACERLVDARLAKKTGHGRWAVVQAGRDFWQNRAR